MRGDEQAKAYVRMCDSIAQSSDASHIFVLLREMHDKNNRAAVVIDIEQEDGTNTTEPQKVANRFARHMQPICRARPDNELSHKMIMMRHHVDRMRKFTDAEWMTWYQDGHRVDEEYRMEEACRPAVDEWGEAGEWDKVMNGKVTEQELGAIVLALKDGKTTSNAWEKNEVFKAMWGSAEFRKRMCEYANARLDGGDADEALGVVPLPMAGKAGDLTQTTNWRALSFQACLAQIEAKWAMARVTRVQEKYNLLDDNQNGCRKSRSCMHNLILVQMAMELNARLYMIMLDAHKAYPTAERAGCSYEMALMRFGGKLWRLIDRMQENKRCHVRCGEAKSEEYPVERGLLEGHGTSAGECT
jgi:hypothetical protein